MIEFPLQNDMFSSRHMKYAETFSSSPSAHITTKTYSKFRGKDFLNLYSTLMATIHFQRCCMNWTSDPDEYKSQFFFYFLDPSLLYRTLESK